MIQRLATWARKLLGAMPAKDRSPLIQLTSGNALPVTQDQYDGARQPWVRRHMNKTGVRPLCHAPFTTLDCSPSGVITPCNHFGKQLAVAHEDLSILDLWRGSVMQQLREQMLAYRLDPDVCRHCVRHIDAGQCGQAFSVAQFDERPAKAAVPRYPTRMIFRLTNECNLACLMCDGETSSRIRREFDKLPPVKPRYGERFFRDVEEILPHLEHVEFYGGEPFLVDEHLQILDLIEKTRARCSIYVNTNGTVLTSRVKRYLDTLNFTCIAVSMDALSPAVHEKVRYGLRSRVFQQNLAYYLDLRKRKPLYLMLNVTEHRKNWFELPEVFRFAAQQELPVHINTCIHPANVALYTLPNDQLQYVLDYSLRARDRLCRELGSFANLPAYDFYLSLLRRELEQREAVWRPAPQASTSLCDGLLASPIPGVAPFDRSDLVLEEVRAMECLDRATRERLWRDMRAQLVAGGQQASWGDALAWLEARLSQAGTEPAAAKEREQAAQTGMRVA